MDLGIEEFSCEGSTRSFTWGSWKIQRIQRGEGIRDESNSPQIQSSFHFARCISLSNFSRQQATEEEVAWRDQLVASDTELGSSRFCSHGSSISYEWHGWYGWHEWFQSNDWFHGNVWVPRNAWLWAMTSQHAQSECLVASQTAQCPLACAVLSVHRYPGPAQSSQGRSQIPGEMAFQSKKMFDTVLPWISLNVRSHSGCCILSVRQTQAQASHVLAPASCHATDSSFNTLRFHPDLSCSIVARTATCNQKFFGSRGPGCFGVVGTC